MLVMMMMFFFFMVFSLPKYVIYISMMLEFLVFFLFISVCFLDLNSSNQMMWMLFLILLICSGLMSINILIIFSKQKGLSLVKL